MSRKRRRERSYQVPGGKPARVTFAGMTFDATAPVRTKWRSTAGASWNGPANTDPLKDFVAALDTSFDTEMSRAVLGAKDAGMTFTFDNPLKQAKKAMN